MNRDEQIIKIISENLNMQPEDIKRDMNLFQDLHADSLDIMTIVSDLETTFDFQFDDSMIDKIITVGDLIDYINSLA